jgi:putative endonuclease
MPTKRQSLGAWGETLALKFLTRRGDILITRNYRTRYGELDLVTRRGDAIVFTEVKTRRTDAYGLPETAVTESKQRRLVESALTYLAAHPEHDGDWQIDVIAVRPAAGLAPEIVHFENAVTG